MSRLEDLIDRCTAQRNILRLATDEVTKQRPSGLVVELGLGSGRTFDFLREKMPGFDIYTFDWKMNANEGCTPEKSQFVKGEIAKTFPKFAKAHAQEACLVHMDFGTKDKARDYSLYDDLVPSLVQVLTPGGLVVSDRRLSAGPFLPVDVSSHLPSPIWTYWLYRLK